MKVVCPNCSAELGVDDDTPFGQHIYCDACGKKFSYLVDGDEFSTERLAYAIAECRKNPEDNRYYSAAPEGARLYIGLIFYGKVFKDRIDVGRYMSTLTEIEPSLRQRDWRYLLEHESNPELVEYFRGKIGAAVRSPASTGVLIRVPRQEAEGHSRDGQEIVKLAEERRMAMAESRNKALAAQQAREWRQKLIGNVTLVACVIAVLIVGYVFYGSWRRAESEARRLEIEERARVEAAERAAEQRRSEEEQALRRNKENAVRALAEERRRQEERQRKENEERLRCAEEKERKVADEARRREEEQRIRNEKEKLANSYDEVLNLYKDDDVLFWDDLKPSERPCSYRGKWYCVVPNEDAGFSLYELTCTNADEMGVMLLSREKVPQPVDEDSFADAVKRVGGLYSTGDKTVIRGCGPSRDMPVEIPTGEDVVAIGEEVFGKKLSCLKKLDVDLSDVQFAVSLLVRKEKTDVSVVGTEDTLGYEAFEKAAEQYVREKKMARISAGGVDLRKPRVTVVEYDGNAVRSVANGVTQVPRRFQFEDEQESLGSYDHYWDGRRCNCNRCKRKRKIEKAREDWERLKKQAQEQALALAEYELALKKAIAQKKKEIVVSKQEVSNVLKSAKAFYRRVSKVDMQNANARNESAKEIGDDEASFPLSGEEVSEEQIRRLTEKLTVKSFCGVKFGEVRDGVGPYCGQGGALMNKFRLFDSYSAFGTQSRRVNRVEIQTNADLRTKTTESIEREAEDVVSLLEKKYGMQFVKRRTRDNYFSYEAESNVAKIRLSGRTAGEPNMTLSYLNKEVDEQEAMLEKRRQKKDVAIPKGEGLEVL